MRSINIHEAKTHLSRIIEEVAAGAEVVIAKAGKPMAKLVSLSERRPTRTLGILAGQLHVPEDFDEPLPSDVLDAFER